MTTGAAPALKLVKSQIVTLSQAGISESDLEKTIADEPSILGLGDEVVLISQQRRHAGAGRLDLLLEDPDEEIRYEVELMLGKLDESHIIRAIEYWDIERRRYPAYDHRAVIIAEDITSRFLNVIQLFSGSIPLLAYQVNCVRVADTHTVTFVQVLDSTELRLYDRPDIVGKTADRTYWVAKVGQPIMSLADDCVSLINEVAGKKRSLNYNKQHVGLAEGGTANNFIYFRPKRGFLGVRAKTEKKETWIQQLEEAGLDVAISKGRVKLNVTRQSFDANKQLIAKFLQYCVREDESSL